MRTFVVLSFVVCLAVAKPQYGYNYEPATAYQTSGLQQQEQQQYSLATAAAALPQIQYTQPQSYAAYPAQDQYYQSYPSQQTAYASQEQSAFTGASYASASPSPAPLQQNEYASAGQTQFEQSQFQQPAYPTASPSPLEQSSFASVGQTQFDQSQYQQSTYQTASPSPLQQTSFEGAAQTQFDQTQYQQTAYPTASPSPLEQTSYAGNQLPLALPTAASFETQGGFQPSQGFVPQQDSSLSTTFNGLTGFNAQPYQTDAAAYSNGAAYDQSQQLFNAGASYANQNADLAQLQQYSLQLSQPTFQQQDSTSGTLDSFNIQSTQGPNPADIAPPAPSPSPAPVQQQDLQITEQRPTFDAQPQQQQDQATFNDQGSQQQVQSIPQPQPQLEQLPQQQPQQDEQPQQGLPNQSQNVLPAEQIAAEPIQARQRTQQEQGPITTIQKHIYVHVPPPGFEEEEPLPPAPVAGHQKRYNIIFIKSPNVVRPTIIQPAQNEDKTIVYVLVKKPEDIARVAQPEVKHDKPEVFFIKYKTQTEGTSIAAEEQEALPEQPQQTDELQQQPIVVEDRSKQPTQAPQFPALEGKEAQALLREEEAQQQNEQHQLPSLPLPLPSRAPSHAGISPLPIDFAPVPKTSSPVPPQNYLPPKYQQ